MKSIEITCQGAATIDHKELEPFQGELKSLSKENYSKLKKMITELGFSEPISVWQTNDGLKILNGHQRLRTITEMVEKEGYHCPPIPVNWVEAENYDQAKRKVLALTSQYGKMETQGLYEFLSDSDIQPHQLGTDYHFPEINTDEFVDEYYKEITEDKSDIEDEVPEVKETNIKLGDIYHLGEHRLMCGDSTNSETVNKLMNGEKADMVFTDPPYGMNLDTDYSKMPRGEKKYKSVLGDDSSFDASFIFDIESSRYCIWGADWFYSSMPEGFSPIVWDKQPLHTVAGPQNQFELCWVKPKEKRVIVRHLWTGFTAKEKNEDRVHPTQKPIEVCIEIMERGGDKVLDLFGGSGSTLIACEKTNRKCFMMEIDPHYCQVIIDRWEQYTGNKAELINETP